MTLTKKLLYSAFFSNFDQIQILHFRCLKIKLLPFFCILYSTCKHLKTQLNFLKEKKKKKENCRFWLEMKWVSSFQQILLFRVCSVTKKSNICSDFLVISLKKNKIRNFYTGNRNPSPRRRRYVFLFFFTTNEKTRGLIFLAE